MQLSPPPYPHGEVPRFRLNFLINLIPLSFVHFQVSLTVKKSFFANILEITVPDLNLPCTFINSRVSHMLCFLWSHYHKKCGNLDQNIGKVYKYDFFFLRFIEVSRINFFVEMMSFLPFVINQCNPMQLKRYFLN